jgi:hypothetical protein
MKFRTNNFLYSLAIAGGLVGLAMAHPAPWIWRILDDSRIALWRPPLGNITKVKVDNAGLDTVTVYAKPFPGVEVVLGTLAPGLGDTYDLPMDTVKVVIDDGLGIDVDTDGAQGTLFWIN